MTAFLFSIMMVLGIIATVVVVIFFIVAVTKAETGEGWIACFLRLVRGFNGNK